ncbi:MAG TPA: proton-conducting transporter membrane subunit [Leptospiraceae bacterium]|nr:proton-conducting transporter membrane subunit [Leptospiraceae bacterium]
MELLTIIAFPVLAFVVHSFLPKQRGAFLVSTLFYSALLVVQSLRAFISPVYLNAGGVRLWGDFALVPSFYLTGLNAPLLLLIGLVLPFVALLLRSVHAEDKRYTLSAWVFLLGLAGTFISQSLILFYVFFETSLIGAYFWIGLFGRSSVSGSPGGWSGLTRFFLFTLVGSLSMLASIAALSSGGKDVRFTDVPIVLGTFSDSGRFWIFAGFALAFAIKLPLFGFHGWLRETYAMAPPAARALLSGIMSKLGAYGFLLLAVYFGIEFRLHSKLIIALCAAGVLYGGLVSLSQKRFLDVVVYSSLAHLNLIVMGLAAMSGSVSDTTIVSACVLQMFNHGLIMAAILVYDARMGSPDESQSGMREHAGILSALLLLSLFAAVSLPGLSSFPPEFAILYAAFKTSIWIAFIAGLGLLISAAALIRSYHRIYAGNFAGSASVASSGETSRMEAVIGVIFGLVWIGLGILPGLMLSPVAAALGVIKL